MTRDMNDLRTAKARSSANAGRLTLVGTGLGALALIAIGAQGLMQPPRAPQVGALAPLADTAPAPQVWLSALTLPDTAPFAAPDYATDPVFPRQQPARAPAAPQAASEQRPEAGIAPAPTTVQRATPVPVPGAVTVTTGSPRVTPPRRPQVAVAALPPAADPQPQAAADPLALAALRAPTRSPLPRQRPAAQAEPQIAAAAPAETTAAPGQIALASLGTEQGILSGLLRSRTPQPRPETVARLASLDLDQPVAPQPQAAAPLEVAPLTTALAAGADRCESALTRAIPRRPGRAGDGSAVIGRLTGAGGSSRDNAIVDEVLAGNVPDFLRDLVPVTFTGNGANGQRTRVTICVTPDYLAVGSNRDFVRVPLGLPAALRVAERFDMVLPTTRMVDAIYQQAQVRLSPAPMDPTSAMASTGYFLRHNATVQGQMSQAGGRLGQLVSGHKKDLVLTNRLQQNPGRVAIYGWHQRNGQAIQPLSTVHGAQYADYSHGIRLVSRRAYVNGRAVDLRDLLSDGRLAGLVSSEGTITNRQLLAALD